MSLEFYEELLPNLVNVLSTGKSLYFTASIHIFNISFTL